MLTGCTSAASTAQAWTLGPTLAPLAAGVTPATPSSPASPAPVASAAATAVVVPTPGPSTAAVDGTPKPFSGRMTPHVLVVDGYVTMYMQLENTGSESLTFINTLYDTEPTRLYSPTVAFLWTTGETALATRAGRFFPSPSIVEPGHSAVYVMGGMQARERASR